ncbi:MAG: hypothetical protein M1827_001484 [Pycnora praestabilis]|nr:MAG: hypothetical protein M1827_001484 [Pycnora praestabilis]
MGPRKRSKPNPKREGSKDQQVVSPAFQAEPGSSSDSADKSEVKDTEGHATGGDGDESDKISRSAQSWYGGTWPRISKATPVTQVARESISAASASASDLVSSARSQGTTAASLGSPSQYLSRTIGSSSRSLPLAATTTKLNITSNASVEDESTSASQRRSSEGKEPQDLETSGDKNPSKGTVDGTTDSKEASQVPLLPAKKNRDIPIASEPNIEGQERESTKREESTNQPQIGEESHAVAATSALWRGWFAKSTESDLNRHNSLSEQETSFSQAASVPLPETSSPAQKIASLDVPDLPKGVERNSIATQQPKSWFGLWSSGAEESTKEMQTNPTDAVQEKPGQDAKPTISETGKSTSQASSETAVLELLTKPLKTTASAIPARSSGWAFWSKNETTSDSRPSSSDGHVGELAIADTPSQSQPEAAKAPKRPPGNDPRKGVKKEKAQALEVPDDPLTRTPRTGVSAKSTPSHSPAPSKGISTETVATKQTQKTAPNVVLPSFRSTYQELPTLSIYQQLARFLLQSNVPATKHVNIVREPPRIKRALAIGVHGYFPAPLIQKVLGQPTGTSIRFANSAADAIKRWTQDKGYSCEIEKVALEGEGKIAERVETLWKLLLNWIDQIQKADFILVACHSQGVPVAMMLVAKLIMFGCVNSARIGVCAMAGVNLGPFADYKSRFFGGSAGELFDFSRPESEVSMKYEGALNVALNYGVRIVYTGSLDDQLVSLESSTFSNISHPYIYRAVFVDGRVHAPDFLAVEHALESTSVGEIPLEVHKYEVSTNANPYILPWAMRGLIEEEYVRTELEKETTELLEQFDNWKPASKVLRDVKFRLEAVKSKL